MITSSGVLGGTDVTLIHEVLKPHSPRAGVPLYKLIHADVSALPPERMGNGTFHKSSTINAAICMHCMVILPCLLNTQHEASVLTYLLFGYSYFSSIFFQIEYRSDIFFDSPIITFLPSWPIHFLFFFFFNLGKIS